MKMKLYARDVLIGTLAPHKERDMDWPRAYFEFESRPEYDEFKSILDLDGSDTASNEQMEAGAKLDLRIESPDGTVIKLAFILLDEKKRLAVVRQGFVKEMTRG